MLVAAQLKGFRLLCTRDFERPLEIRFGSCCIPLWRHQGDFAGDGSRRLVGGQP